MRELHELLDSTISVGLSARQKAALTAYCEYVGAPVSAHVRHLITSEVPARFWQPQKPPPGQLQIEETT